MTFNVSEMTHHEEEGCGLRPFPEASLPGLEEGSTACPLLSETLLIVDHSQTYESEKVGCIYLLYSVLNVKT